MVTMANEVESMSLADLQEAKKNLQNRLDNEKGLSLFNRQLIFSELQDVKIELDLRAYKF